VFSGDQALMRRATKGSRKRGAATPSSINN
jgi:hypothetical protein